MKYKSPVIPSEKPSLVQNLLWLLPCFLLVLLQWHTWSSADVWMHLYRGRLIAEGFPILQPDPAFVMPHKVGFYWLFNWLLYRIYDLAGISGVNSLFSLIWTAAFYFAWRLTRPGFWTMLWSIIGILVMHVRFQERPEAFSFLFVMIFIFALVKSKGWWKDKKKALPLALTLGLTQIVWANMHGFFILGPALVLLALFVDAFETALWEPKRKGKFRQPVQSWGGLFVLVVLLGMVSPFGWQNYQWVFEHFRQLHDLRDVIAEFRPLHLTGRLAGSGKFRIFCFAYLGVMALLTLWVLFRRKPLFEVLLAGLGIGLCLVTVRFLPFSFFLLSPIVGLWSTQRKEQSWERKALVFPCILCVLLIVSIGNSTFYRFTSSSARTGVGLTPQLSPVKMSEKLCPRLGDGSLFNESTDGGYLAFHCPQLHLYGHSLHTNSAWSRRYLQVSSLADLAQISDPQPFDGALLEVRIHHNLIVDLLRSEKWELRAVEPCRAFFIRKGGRLDSMERLPFEFFDANRSFREIPFGLCSLNWVSLIGTTARIDLLMDMLNQSSKPVDIPGPLLSMVYEYALFARDRDVAGRALSLSSKAVFPDDAQFQNFQAIQDRAVQEFDLKSEGSPP